MCGWSLLLSAELQQQTGQGLGMLCGQKDKTMSDIPQTHGRGRGRGLTFVLEVLQDGDDGLQRDAVGQEQLPGAVLLEGLPVQRLDCGHRGDRERWTGPLLTACRVCVCVYFSLRMLSTESFLNITRFPIIT